VRQKYKSFHKHAFLFLKNKFYLGLFLSLNVALLLMTSGCTKKEPSSTLEILLPEGDQISYSTSSFSVYTKNDFQVFLREVIDNKNLLTKAEITPSVYERSTSQEQYKYLIPRGSTIDGFLALQVVMNSYSSFPLTAFIFSRDEVIEPSIESTLLYQLVSQYPDKEIRSYTKIELMTLLQYIKEFSKNRIELFGIKPNTPPKNIYNFLKNGLSVDVGFLDLAKTVGLVFEYDALGNNIAKPYPFGIPNNPPYLDDSRSTPSGILSGYESIRVDVRAEALDGDDDMLFIYWRYEDEIVLKDEHKWQKMYDFNSSNEIDKKNNPPFYRLQAIISDGGHELITDWNIYVTDNNRPPDLSYNCPTTIHEGESFECSFKALDLDGDLLRFNGLSLEYYNARPTLNGVPWPGPTDFSSEMIFRWSPKNRNFTAAKANTILSLVADDGKSGKASAVLNLTMVDKNSPPYPYVDLQGFTLRQIDDGEGPPRTLQLLNGKWVDSITKKAGTDTTAKKFYFELLLLDDDNLNLNDIADFDDLPQPLAGTSEFQPLTIAPYDPIPANSIVHMFPPQDSPAITQIHVEHSKLSPSTVVDGIANNPFFQATFIRDTASNFKTILPKGTILNKSDINQTDEFTYILPADVVLPSGAAGTKISAKVDHVLDIPPKIRSYDIPAINPEDAKEFIQITVNGTTKIAKRFVYSWIPTPLIPSVTANFLPKDDHGGKGSSFRFEKIAQIYSQLPDCTAGINFAKPTTGQSTLLSSSATCTDTDNSQGSTYFELTVDPFGASDTNSNLYKLIPFLKRGSGTPSNTSMIFKSDLFGGAGQYRYLTGFSSGAAPLNITQTHYAQSAGVLVFSRPGCSLNASNSSISNINSPVTIPAGTLFRSSYNGNSGATYRPRVTFETAAPVTLESHICSAIVPIIPNITSRNLAANGLIIIEAPAGKPVITGISTSHLGALGTSTVDAYSNTASIDVTFKRDVPGASNTIINVGTAVRTDEASGSESLVYFVPVDTILPAGDAGTSAVIRVVRDFNSGVGTSLSRPMTYYESTGDKLLTSSIGANSITWVGAPIADLILSQPAPVMPHTAYSLQKQNLLTAIPVSTRILDGNMASENEFVSFAVMGLAAAIEPPSVATFRSNPNLGDLKIRNPAFIDPLYGVVEIFRTQSGPDMTIPSGLIISTPNRKLYKVFRSEILGSQNSVYVFVERFYEDDFSPAITKFSFQWQIFNLGVNVIDFINAMATVNVFPNQFSEFPIVVGDNTGLAPGGPMVPLNPWDRYYISPTTSGSGIEYMTATRPDGSLLLCRKPINIDPICSPCTNASDLTLSNNETRYCYLRITATMSDAAKILEFKMSLSELGPSLPLAPTIRSGRIVVNESNTAPSISNNTYDPVATSCNSDYPNKTYLFANPVAPSVISAAPATFSTSCEVPLITEGQSATVALYAVDKDKDADNQRISQFQLSEKIFDLATKTEIARPTSLTITGFNANLIPPIAKGTKAATINLVWNPTDDDAKKLSTSEGFIIGVRAIDSSKVDTPKAGIAYYKVIVRNINSPPSFGPITLMPTLTSPSVFQIYINTYFKAVVSVYDADFGSIASPAFSTNLSLCRRIDNSLVKHPTFDTTTTNDPTVCHFTGPEWEAPYWSLTYSGNSTVSACRLANGSLNPDLIIPRITRTAGPTLAAPGPRVKYDFTIEWCPQESYIGKYNVGLSATDNGDVWRSGTIDLPISGSALMSLDVVSNVYLLAPRYSSATATASPRQTAALEPPFHFVFPLFARNPLGNKLQYSLLPTTTAAGIAIDPNTGILNWATLSPTMPNLDTLATANPLLMPKVGVQVLDIITEKKDQVTFSLRVQDPKLAPYEQDPEIKIISPDNTSTLFLNEKQTQIFEAQAYDANLSEPNNDKLWAVWYLDDSIVQEQELSAQSGYFYPLTRYYWRPTDSDGSNIGQSNGTKLSVGEHSLRVSVTDGNKWTQSEWRVRVRNTYVVPGLLLSIQDERKLAEAVSNRTNVNTFKWSSELPFANILTGQTRLTEFLIFSGSYLRNNLLKKYLWRVDIQDDKVIRINNPTSNNWNFYEWLNLTQSGSVQRLAAKPDPTSAGNPVIYGVSKTKKDGIAYNGVSEAFALKGNMTQIAQNLPTSYACSSSTCDEFMFRAPNYSGSYYGNINSASKNDRTFYIDDTFKNLYWDINQQLASRKLILNVTGAKNINGLVLNKNTNHLFISYSDGLPGNDVIKIFDIGPALSSESADISTPLFTYSVIHPTSPSQATMPSEMALASKAGRDDQVFVYLRGSGGLLVIQDPPSPGTITSSNFQFKGTNTISASQSDIPMSGLKIGYDSVSDNIIGISREGRQIYTVNPDNLAVNLSTHVPSLTTTYVNATNIRMDALMIMPLTGSIYFVDRGNSMIFKGK
jgi:hypothetical protein